MINNQKRTELDDVAMMAYMDSYFRNSSSVMIVWFFNWVDA